MKIHPLLLTKKQNKTKTKKQETKTEKKTECLKINEKQKRKHK